MTTEKAMNQNNAIENESIRLLRSLRKLQSGLRFLVFFPEDMVELYHTALINRMKHWHIQVKVEKFDEDSESKDRNERILRFYCQQPDTIFEDVWDADTDIAVEHLLDVEGEPKLDEMMPFAREGEAYTDLEKRFLYLHEQIQAREESEHLWKMVGMQHKIRTTLQKIQSKKHEIADLQYRIERLDFAYFQILEYLLKEAVDHVMDLKRLGEVMKRYVRILIIDDLGERTYDQLEKRGFRKRFISLMSLHQFNKTFSAFKKQYHKRYPGKTPTYQDYFTKCTVFEDYEIVFYNPWKTAMDGLPVQFRLKKNPALSKKEIRRLEEDPAKIALKVKKVSESINDLQKQLTSVENDLKKAEKEGGTTESAYVAVNKKRKRLIRSLKKKTDELSDLQKEVNYKPVLMFYIRNFITLLRNKRLVKELLEERSNHQDQLDSLARLVKQKSALEREINQLNTEVKSTIKELEDYADRFPLDPDLSYQQVLGSHILDKLEMAILGSCIATSNQQIRRHPGAFFQHLEGNGGIDWNNDLISRTSLFIASKKADIETGYLKAFFRIGLHDLSERMIISPALPQKRDFESRVVDLVIINYESYPHSDIMDCLKMRNQIKGCDIPILIYDPQKAIKKHPEYFLVDLQIGLVAGENNRLRLQIPPYTLSSLSAPDSLIPVICEQMGIDLDTVPNLIDNSSFDNTRQAAIQEQTLQDTSLDSADKEVANKDDSKTGERKRENIQQKTGDWIPVFPPEDEPEVIYSLGDLFSFDDQFNTDSEKAESRNPSEPEHFQEEGIPGFLEPENQPTHDPLSETTKENAKEEEKEEIDWSDSNQDETEGLDGSHLF